MKSNDVNEILLHNVTWSVLLFDNYSLAEILSLNDRNVYIEEA